MISSLATPSRRRIRHSFGGNNAGRKLAVSSSTILKFLVVFSFASLWLLARYVHFSTNNISASAALKETPLDFSAYIKSSHDLKQEFYQRYGGKDIAQLLLRKSIITFSPSSSSSSEGGDNNRYGLHHTAKRILYAVAKKQPFILAFGGYSITVGRGNYFNQSYPLVLESILKDSVKLLNIEHFEIRNAAIGGIPSFPYGWCLKNFLGEDSDVVSWDFSMNEGDSAEGKILSFFVFF